MFDRLLKLTSYLLIVTIIGCAPNSGGRSGGSTSPGGGVSSPQGGGSDPLGEVSGGRSGGQRQAQLPAPTGGTGDNSGGTGTRVHDGALVELIEQGPIYKIVRAYKRLQRLMENHEVERGDSYPPHYHEFTYVDHEGHEEDEPRNIADIDIDSHQIETIIQKLLDGKMVLTLEDDENAPTVIQELCISDDQGSEDGESMSIREMGDSDHWRVCMSQQLTNYPDTEFERQVLCLLMHEAYHMINNDMDSDVTATNIQNYCLSHYRYMIEFDVERSYAFQRLQNAQLSLGRLLHRMIRHLAGDPVQSDEASCEPEANASNELCLYFNFESPRVEFQSESSFLYSLIHHTGTDPVDLAEFSTTWLPVYLDSKYRDYLRYVQNTAGGNFNERTPIRVDPDDLIKTAKSVLKVAEAIRLSRALQVSLLEINDPSFEIEIHPFAQAMLDQLEVTKSLVTSDETIDPDSTNYELPTSIIPSPSSDGFRLADYNFTCKVNGSTTSLTEIRSDDEGYPGRDTNADLYRYFELELPAEFEATTEGSTITEQLAIKMRLELRQLTQASVMVSGFHAFDTRQGAFSNDDYEPIFEIGPATDLSPFPTGPELVDAIEAQSAENFVIAPVNFQSTRLVDRYQNHDLFVAARQYRLGHAILSQSETRFGVQFQLTKDFTDYQNPDEAYNQVLREPLTGRWRRPTTKLMSIECSLVADQSRPISEDFLALYQIVGCRK